MGVALFIVSEVFAFVSVFWAYFHSSLAPTIELGSSWPPVGIEPLDPFAIPLLNTILLLSSGATITYAHHALIQGNRNGAMLGTFLTLVLAIAFTGLQGLEYMQASFSMSDSVFGTVFFASTGLHGLTRMAPFKINGRTILFIFSGVTFTTILKIVFSLGLLGLIGGTTTVQPIGSELTDTLAPAVAQIFFSSILPIKPADGKPHRLTKLEQSQFTISEDLKSILVGLALGDLFINKQNVNARLEFKQGLIHVDYLMEVYDRFKDFCPTVPKTVNPQADKRTGKVYSFSRFVTYSLPCFNPFYELFYENGKKIVPLNIGELLTPLGLCYWICDDGTYHKENGSAALSTHSFSLQEVNLLIKTLISLLSFNYSYQ